MTHHVIIGMGVAGISAALALRELDRSAAIFMICDDPSTYYSRPGLAYYLTGEIPEKQLYPFIQQDWKALDIQVVKTHATRLNPVDHLVEIENGSPIKYDRLLLATGAASASLNVPGEDLQGIVKLDELRDAREILKLAHHSRGAVVVGGGIASIELVEGLAARGVKVHYFLRGDRYWSNVLDTTESVIIEERLAHEGVQLHHQTEIAEILGRKGKVEGVLTKKGEIIKCGIVGKCIGVRPRLELALSGGLNIDRGVLTNENLQTSDPDVFAAGDVAQVFDAQTKRSVVDSLWNPSRMQGKAAGMNMAGRKHLYQRNVDVNVVRLANIMVSIIGSVGSGRDADLVSVARGSSETWMQLPNSISAESGNEFNHLRLMVGERTLLGALVLGDQKLSIPLQELVANQTDISPIRSRLIDAGPGLGQVVMNYWNGLRESR